MIYLTFFYQRLNNHFVKSTKVQEENMDC